ncbi:hypothetical protein [Nonomuraea sp. NPDC005692]|uniref:hypothetical protein n=1 Tax=Nonomuraea sp. NPDC005692 TaxID=3157168 RepID=UPI0033C8DA75
MAPVVAVYVLNGEIATTTRNAAQSWHAGTDLTLRLFGFVLLVDHRQDQGESVMEHTPVPPLWLRAHPDLAVPHLREAAAAAPVMTVDEAFEHVMHGVIVIVRDLLAPAGELHMEVADQVEVFRSAGPGTGGGSAGITSRPPVR